MTLIEVMLAVAILGIAGVSLVAAIGQGMSVVRSAQLYAHAHTLLARLELEHPLFDEDIAVGVERGSFYGEQLGAFAWQRTIETVGEEEDSLYQVTAQVSWSRRGRRSFEEVVYYRFAPEEDL